MKEKLFFHPTVTLYTINDFADNRLLELAEESRADFLITGNTNDFVIEKHKETKIIEPRHYYENYYPR
ncbi:hypothetical protein [Mucilaginibacter sp. OK098]|uniref:hypothetical protein n=1 Tax=Mucilaginibacter sp. OK098 TaxID=1855297 RepID=UPI0009351E01|nr:hypothetical protein [Mucilaginibacter sp. OK098]